MKQIRNHFIIFMVILSACSVNNKDSRPGILISADRLQEQLKDPLLVLLHVGSTGVYDSIHIPGARFIDPYDFTYATDSLSNEIPDPDTITGLLRRAGVNTDSKIVLYYEDEGLISRTTRVFLALDYVGLGDRTAVLNGGLTGWIEEGKGTTDTVPEISEGDLTAGSTREVIIGARELDRQRWNNNYVIVDVRSSEEYYGELDSTGSDPSGGHIEGAYFLPYLNMLSDSVPYRFKDDAELEQEFEKVGMKRDKMTVYYCRTGVRASVSYLAARHLGYSVKVYDGSFQEWDELDLPLTPPAVEPSGPD